MIFNQTLDEKKIIFISSYPKSGNTWIRILVSALLNKKNGLFEFNDLRKILLFSSLKYFSSFKNISYQKNGNLDFNFVSNNWINAQKKINRESNEICFFKTHSTRGIINGHFFTDKAVCLGFIYIVRDPRDLVISLAHHQGISIDKAIKIMLFKNDFVTSPDKVNEPVCTWKNHLDSWNTFKSVSRLIIKYEDLLNDTNKELNQIINFLTSITGLKIINKDNLINNVLNSTKFHRLQKIENEKGFEEASKFSNFFREGKQKQWKKILNFKQIDLIEKELYEPMSQLGYL